MLAIGEEILNVAKRTFNFQVAMMVRKQLPIKKIYLWSIGHEFMVILFKKRSFVKYQGYRN